MIDADVLVIGENRIFCDIVFYELPRIPKPGEEIFAKNLAIRAGGAFFPAAGLSRLGVRAALSGVLGTDPLSRLVVEQIESEKVITDFIRTKKGIGVPTTVSLSIHDRALASWMPKLQGYIKNLHRKLRVKLVHLPGFGVDLPIELIKDFKNAGATISIDASYKPEITMKSKRFRTISEVCDILFCNEVEALYLTGKSNYRDAIKELCKHFDQTIVKLGPKGAVCMCNGKLTRGKPHPAKVVDTTGAGEAFVAGYLYGFINGYSIPDCLNIANFCGARCIEGPGLGNFPTLKELKRTLLLEAKLDRPKA